MNGLVVLAPSGRNSGLPILVLQPLADSGHFSQGRNYEVRDRQEDNGHLPGELHVGHLEQETTNYRIRCQYSSVMKRINGSIVSDLLRQPEKIEGEFKKGYG